MVLGMHVCRAAHWEGVIPWEELYPIDKINSGTSWETYSRGDEYYKESKCVEVYIGSSSKAKGSCKQLYKI
jgi:hypothetical protein